MRRIGDMWLLTTKTLREMAHIAEEHGADEGLLFIGMESKVRDPEPPDGGDTPKEDGDGR